MLVMRTDNVSPPVHDPVPARKVKRTVSPTRSPRIIWRSSTSSMPSRRRISSIFSISTGFRMLVLSFFEAESFRRLILTHDLRRGGEDIPRAVGDEEIAVGNLCCSRVHADDDVSPVMVFPQEADLNPVQTIWLAKAEKHLFADRGFEVAMHLFFYVRGLLF